MLNQTKIHNSAMLRPQLARHQHVYNEMKDGQQVCSECGKLKNKG